MSTLEGIAVGVLVCLIWRLLHPRRDRAAATILDLEDFGPPESNGPAQLDTAGAMAKVGAWRRER